MLGTEDSDLAMLSSFIHRLQWRLRVNRKTRWDTERGMSTTARRTREPIKRVVPVPFSHTPRRFRGPSCGRCYCAFSQYGSRKSNVHAPRKESTEVLRFNCRGIASPFAFLQNVPLSFLRNSSRRRRRRVVRARRWNTCYRYQLLCCSRKLLR